MKKIECEKRKIKNNLEFIIYIMKYYNINITEQSFKCGIEDEEIYFSHNGQTAKIIYNWDKDVYDLYHLNIRENKKRKFKYHLQRSFYTIPSLGRWLVNWHNY